jgi:hypothetical protein
MEFKDVIDKEPMILMDNAFDIISYATIIQHGIVYPDKLNDAIERTKSHLLSLTLSQNSITKEYKDCHFESVDEAYVEECGVDTSRSLVNVKELLFVYNADRKAHGAPPTKISKWVHIPNSGPSDFSAYSRSIVDLASTVACITRDAISRDEQLKVEIFDSIFNEATQRIQDKDMITLLPQVKADLRETLKLKFAKGRVSNVTDKKILAGIHLSDMYRQTAPDMKKLKEDISGFELNGIDKDHVVRIFKEHRNS